MFTIIRVYMYTLALVECTEYGRVLCFVGVNRNGNNTRYIACTRERKGIERSRALRWDQYRALQKYGKRGKAGSDRSKQIRRFAARREEKLERKERPKVHGRLPLSGIPISDSFSIIRLGILESRLVDFNLTNHTIRVLI